MSAAAPLLPQAFWFRPTLFCFRADDIPQEKEPPLDLPASFALPDFEGLEGRETRAEVRAAWNNRGIGFEFRVQGKKRPIDRPAGNPSAFDNGIELFLDTRDTRDVHRATRFCHRFRFGLLLDARKRLKPAIDRRKIPRALADAPIADAEPPRAFADRIGENDWRLEVWFPAEALNGYDPETNRRLGIYYEIRDSERSSQFLAVGRDFPIGEDPSLWLSLELKDARV